MRTVRSTSAVSTSGRWRSRAARASGSSPGGTGMRHQRGTARASAPGKLAAARPARKAPGGTFALRFTRTPGPREAGAVCASAAGGGAESAGVGGGRQRPSSSGRKHAGAAEAPDAPGHGLATGSPPRTQASTRTSCLNRRIVHLPPLVSCAILDLMSICAILDPRRTPRTGRIGCVPKS
jgi:hypothetical protein